MVKLSGLALGALLLAAAPALAGGFFTNGVPPAGGTQYPTTLPLTGNETIPADTNLSGGQAPQSEAISTGQLVQFAGGVMGGGNALIGGDASTNLFQRGTTGASVTTTATYGGPDRWFYWSGTSTAMTVSKDTTAGDFPAGFQAAFKMQRTASQTGLVQMCMSQEVETANAVRFAGQPAEFDFYALTGANFSGSGVTAYITYGTGTDEGSSKLAYGLNAGGGGSTGWTGQANAAAATVTLGTSAALTRYGVVANIPSTATELAFSLCYTPTGTAGTNDWVSFSAIQAKPSSFLASYASSSVVYAVGASTQVPPLSGYEKRLTGLETSLQERYFLQLGEPGSGVAVQDVFCEATGATAGQCVISNPVTMRAAGVFTYSAGTLKLNIAGTATAVGTLTAATGTTGGCTFTHAATNTAGQVEQVQGAGGSGYLACSAEL